MKHLPKVKIAIVDNDERYRTAMVDVLNSQSDWCVVANCDGVPSAIKSIPGMTPDLILLDVRMPRIDGIDAIQPLRKSCPKAKILMLTVEENAETIVQCLREGATGYLLKIGTPSDIRLQIQNYLNGHIPMTPSISWQLIAWFNGPKDREPAANEQLSPREREALRLMSRGKQQKEIAEILGISIHTVKNHFRNIYQKLEVNNAREAVFKLQDLRPENQNQ